MGIREISIEEIAHILGLNFFGKNKKIDGLGFCNKKSSKRAIISFIEGGKFKKYLEENNNIEALFIEEKNYTSITEILQNKTVFITNHPENVFYDLHDYLISNTNFYDEFNFKKKVGNNVIIQPSSIIEDGVTIGNNVKIGYNTTIMKGSTIGNNVIIGNGTIIGSEGFQLIKDKDNKNRLIEHCGGCTIADNVFIGDNCSIGNSLFENVTFIGENTKIDNLVHVAHNCIIGRNCVLTAGVILSGSTTIENNVWIAPNSTINNKVILNDNSFVGIGSVVLKSIEKDNKVFGNPAKLI